MTTQDSTAQDRFTLAEKEFTSRMIMGTSAYRNPQMLIDALDAGGAEIITVSMRRVDFSQLEHTFMSNEKLKSYHLLPNTAGCYTAKDAILTAELARQSTGSSWIKVEVIGDDYTLMPDSIELLKACEDLVAKGFIVLPYCSDDPILCKRLQDMGCAAVMPLAAPIGSGLGIRNPHNLELIRKAVDIPLIVDAGIGTASDAARAMELGCDAILLNTAIAGAISPVLMAEAMKLAVQAGRKAYLAGRIPAISHAAASSPQDGMIGS